MHQGFFRPNYIFNNDTFFIDFRSQKFPLIFYSFITSTSPAFWVLNYENNIKKAPVKFHEGLLYF